MDALLVHCRENETPNNNSLGQYILFYINILVNCLFIAVFFWKWTTPHHFLFIDFKRQIFSFSISFKFFSLPKTDKAIFSNMKIEVIILLCYLSVSFAVDIRNSIVDGQPISALEKNESFKPLNRKARLIGGVGIVGGIGLIGAGFGGPGSKKNYLQ